MDIELRDAATPGELSNFALAQIFYRRVGFLNPVLAFNVTCELVVPDMAPIGTDKSLATVLTALSPDAQNINLEQILLLPPRPERVRAESRHPKHFEVTGTQSNRDLATILNKLARLGEPESAAIRPNAESDMSHLPVNSQKAIEARRVREVTERGEAFKEKTHFILVRELQRLLYDNRGPVDLKMQNATHELPMHLVDGDRIQKAVYEVIDHFGSVGDFMRNGATLREAVSTRKRMQELWSQLRPKVEIN